MKKVIVSTTIQSPTESIERFDNLRDWTLVVAGDLRTPKDYRLKNGIYLSPQAQEKRHKKLSDLIGWNSHARRNFALLAAKELKADIVALVDDDNLPLDHWGKDLVVGQKITANFYRTSEDAFDPLRVTNYPHLWHRGFPVQLVSSRNYDGPEKREVPVDIQADLWNGDPDVDAVCRMVYKPECQFDRGCFPIASDKPSPFNSQNIFITKRVLPHYFILPHLSPLGRESDIWIAYHLWSRGFRVVYCEPSVYQKRNPHDLTQDMEDEFLGYKRNIDIVRAIADKSYDPRKFWPEATCRAYEAYQAVFGQP